MEHEKNDRLELPSSPQTRLRPNLYPTLTPSFGGLE